MRCVVICVVALAIGLAPAALCQLDLEVSTFTNDEIGVSFIYPTAWGPPVVQDYRGTASYMDYGVDWRISFTEDPTPCRAYILARGLGESPNLRIVAYESSIDTTDLDRVRQAIVANPDRIVDGHSARVVDRYYEPGGEAWRVTTWFSDGQFFELIEAARVHDFEGKAEDAGLRRGVTQIFEANPDDARLLQFTRATRLLLDSIHSQR